jgi:hypothetical protein
MAGPEARWKASDNCAIGSRERDMTNSRADRSHRSYRLLPSTAVGRIELTARSFVVCVVDGNGGTEQRVAFRDGSADATSSTRDESDFAHSSH